GGLRQPAFRGAVPRILASREAFWFSHLQRHWRTHSHRGIPGETTRNGDVDFSRRSLLESAPTSTRRRGGVPLRAGDGIPGGDPVPLQERRPPARRGRHETAGIPLLCRVDARLL